MDAKYLRKLSRKDIQKLAKREKIKANIKSEVIIELLLGKYPQGIPRLIAPAPRRIVKTESVEEATSTKADTKDEESVLEPTSTSNNDVAGENEDTNDKAEAGQTTEEPVAQIGLAASATTSATIAKFIPETTTQAGHGQSKSINAFGPEAEAEPSEASQGTAALAIREPQEIELENAQAVALGLEVNANGGDTAPNSPAGSDSDPLEESAAVIEARRKAKGKGRATDETPEPEEVDDEEWCLEWWENDEDRDMQLAVELDAAEQARDAALGVTEDRPDEDAGDSAEEKVQKRLAQGPTKPARPVRFNPISEDYGPVDIYEEFMIDAGAIGTKYLMQKALRMGTGKRTPRPTPPPSPVPSRAPSPVPTEVDGTPSPRELSPAGSNLSRLQVSSDEPTEGSIPEHEPIRGATQTRARQILHCLTAMADELGDLRRDIEEVAHVVHVTKLKIKDSKDILRHTRRYRKVIQKHYIEVLKSDKRLHNGTHSWWPAQEGEADRDYSYYKEVSDEPSSSDMVASSSSSAKGSDPVSEEAENVPIEGKARSRKSLGQNRPGVLPQRKPFRQFSPKGNVSHKAVRKA